MTSTLDGCAFHHEALFYGDGQELLAGTIPFLRAGADADEAMLVAMPPESLRLVEGEMSGEAERIQFVDMEQLGRNPARIISAWRDFVAEHLHGDRGVRGIGEPIWAGRSPAEVEECVRHESLLNLAFADAPAWSLLCPYNTTALDEPTLRSAEHNHPFVSDEVAPRQSTAYSPPLKDGNPFAGELAPPMRILAELSFGARELGKARRLLSEHAREQGLGSTRVQDLMLAANELATNSVLHGGGTGTICVWRENGSVGCDIRDAGEIAEPLVGRQRPAPDQRSGRGVWLANQLCDLVQIRSGPEGNLVRLHMAL